MREMTVTYEGRQPDVTAGLKFQWYPRQAAYINFSLKF